MAKGFWGGKAKWVLVWKGLVDFEVERLSGFWGKG